jgi:catechol 2,3-dioxygenase-like lactoylglutathione lyase family enzyme
VISGLHHVQLACPAGSEPVLREFYGGLLGMAEVPKPAALAGRGGAWFRAGTAEIHLGVEPDFRPARKAHPGLTVSDLDTLARRLVAAGHDVVADGRFPGYRRIYTADPYGNRLEFLQPSVGDGVIDGDARHDQADPQRDADDHGRHDDAAEPEPVQAGVPVRPILRAAARSR